MPAEKPFCKHCGERHPEGWICQDKAKNTLLRLQHVTSERDSLRSQLREAHEKAILRDELDPKHAIYAVVWCPRYGPPTVRHPDEAEALKEAMRMAEEHPQHTFHVLTCVGAARAMSVARFTKDPEDIIRTAPARHVNSDETPF
jgi:hypothetical protein